MLFRSPRLLLLWILLALLALLLLSSASTTLQVQANMPALTDPAPTPPNAPLSTLSSSGDLTPPSTHSPTRLPEKLPFEGGNLHADNSPHGDVELGMAGLPGGPLDGCKEVVAREGEPPRVMKYPDGGWRAWR